MREMWRIRRGWIKVHAIVDVETNQILEIKVTDESVQDDKTFILLLDQTVENCGNDHKLNRVFGDGAYDRNAIFNDLEKPGIISGVNPRQNASTRSTGSPIELNVLGQKKKCGGYQEWSKAIGYDMRWKVEWVF